LHELVGTQKRTERNVDPGLAPAPGGENHIEAGPKDHYSRNEAGFYLLPMRVRTYAPVGQTPVLRVPLTRDHLSAIGGITPEGWMYMQMQESAYGAEDVVRFYACSYARSAASSWSSGMARRSTGPKRSMPSWRLHLERLPGYAPALNPL